MDFASLVSGRDSRQELEQKLQIMHREPMLQEILDAMPGFVLLLNERRQAVAANRTLLDTLGVDADGVLGCRPGEVMGCAHWREGTEGCGTAPHCLTCGAVAALLLCQQRGEQVTRECRMTLRGDARTAVDLRVSARRLTLAGQRFIVCAIDDISDQKRLGVLMRCFFHDVLNTAGSLSILTRMFAEGPALPAALRADAHRLTDLTEQLIDEIQSQRDLMSAEAGDLTVSPSAVRPRAVLEQLLRVYSAHPLAASRRIELLDCWDGSLVTDACLLGRVLGNMLKNALEATAADGVVTARCTLDERQVVFSVHNEGAIPAEVQLQVFQRSFSTKGQTGRGIGTHSMKLLGERYLKGQVSFTSSPEAGTCFVLRLPRVLLD